ncbi:APC family permease [Cryptosporangium aurantiacum]|uniref:Amino acid/polyamine/organocation transporter, APC superfamily n=1 Tax=Cryptosporangium aurantiacum TaxID=134849 RepID=A0A1M7RMM7_9ACTN|nr:APC family permease [Cryptosporangium aurantiacum]SHN47338.1 amino acid/polyamine/organocation transporter, APC superfamily [Cryptosporangium aurantiacum]
MDDQPALTRSLGVVDGVVIAASSTAATTSIAIGTGVLASIVGRQVPILLFLAFLPILGIAGAYARLNRSEQNCGTGYTWVGRTMGPWLGFLAGWIPLAGTVIFLAYTTAITGSLLIQSAEKLGFTALDPNSTAQCTALGLGVLALLTWTAVLGVSHAARFQKYLLIFEYVVLAAFCGWGLVVGDQGFSLSWLNPFAIDSASALAQGLVLAVFFFWGWDSAFSVTEETRNPGDAARGGYIALFTMLGLFLLGAIAFQRVLSTDELVTNGAQGLTYFGAKLAPEPWATLPLLALMFSAVASVQAGVIPTARLALAMSRDRTLGPIWARLSRRGTPAAGTIVMAVIAGFVAVLAFAIPTLSEAILAAVNTIGLLVALYYGLTAITAAVRFRGLLRGGIREALGAVVVPLVSGIVLLALGVYLAGYYATLSTEWAIGADNGWFSLAAPGVVLLLGLVVAAVAKWHRRSPYFTRRSASTEDTLAPTIGH